MATGRGDSGMTDVKSGRIYKSSDVIYLLGQLDETNVHICDSMRIVGDIIKSKRVESDLQIDRLKTFETIFSNLEKIVSIFYKTMSFFSGYLDYKEINYDVKLLDLTIKNVKEILPELKGFILPCSTVESASFDKSRVNIRKTEILLWRYIENGDDVVEYPDLMRFINRLSIYFFQVSRFVMVCSKGKDILIKNL
jgi:ATP:cob(I)alamin adenosyltransferase